MTEVSEITDRIKSLNLDEGKRQAILANAKAAGVDVTSVDQALNSLMNVSSGSSLRSEGLEAYRAQLALVSLLSKGSQSPASGNGSPSGAVAGANAGLRAGQVSTSATVGSQSGGIGIERFQSRVIPQDGFGYGGILVHVVTGSPAHTAGLQNGDEVLFINGESVSDGAPGSRNRFASALAASPVGSEVVLKVRRAGGIVDIRVQKTPGFVDATEAVPLGFPTVGSFAGDMTTKGGSNGNNNTDTGSAPTGIQTSAGGVKYDASKINTSSIVGDVFAWHQTYSVPTGINLPIVSNVIEWVGGRRTAPKSLSFEFIQSVDGVTDSSRILKFNADEGECAQFRFPSNLLTQYALTRDANGNFSKFNPLYLRQLPRNPQWGVEMWSEWNNVVIYGVGNTRTRAGLGDSPAEKTLTDEKLRKEINAFLQKKELGDYLPVYIIEPTGLFQGSINTSLGLGTKTLYIKRKDLETYVAGLK